MAGPSPGSQRAAMPSHGTAQLPLTIHPHSTVMLEEPGQLPTLTQPQLLPG